MIFSHVLYRLSYLGTSRYSSHLQHGRHGKRRLHSEYSWGLTRSRPGYNPRKEGHVTFRFVSLDPYKGRQK